MLTTLLGKDFITTEDWSVDQLNALLEMAGDLKRRFACGLNRRCGTQPWPAFFASLREMRCMEWAPKNGAGTAPVMIRSGLFEPGLAGPASSGIVRHRPASERPDEPQRVTGTWFNV